jgi:hypothetical protein
MKRPHFTFQHDAYRPDTVKLGKQRDDQYRQFHYDLCQGINMTRVSIALGQMVEAGVLDKRMAELFHMQAASLLALMTSENNRAFQAGPALPTPTTTPDAGGGE